MRARVVCVRTRVCGVCALCARACSVCRPRYGASMCLCLRVHGVFVCLHAYPFSYKRLSLRVQLFRTFHVCCL